MPEDNILEFNNVEQTLVGFAPAEESNPYIKVIGVGGAGVNAVNYMFREGIKGVDFIVCNTDEQSLKASPIKNQIKIGKYPLGAGNNPEKGRKAVLDAEDKVKQALSDGTRMLFIAAGMGGGTGTGAAPEIARMAKEIIIEDEEDEKILVVAVVNTPFPNEGRKRLQQAEEGIKNLRQYVDATIVVSTEKLRNFDNMRMSEAFATLDNILLTAVKGLAEIMTTIAYIQVDFQDVQSIMKNQGVALMGSGVAEGEDRAVQAVDAAINCDLLNDDDISQSKNVLYYITCSHEYEVTTDELTSISNRIAEKISKDVNIIWGYGFNDSLGEKVSITLIATGFESNAILPSNGQVEEKKPEKIVAPMPPIDIVETPVETKEDDKKEEDAFIENIVIKPTPEPVKEEETKVEPEPEPKKVVVGVLNIENIDEEATTPISEPVAVETPEPEILPKPTNEPINIIPEAPVTPLTPSIQVQEKINITPVTPTPITPSPEQRRQTLGATIGDSPRNQQAPLSVEERRKRMEAVRNQLHTREGVLEVEKMGYGAVISNSSYSKEEVKDRVLAVDNGELKYMEQHPLHGTTD